MTITAIEPNNRKHRFEVAIDGEKFVFPYAKADPAPSSADPLVEVAPDPELGNEAFTFQLASGAEGTIHSDAVLEYNQDPSTMADLAIYQLTLLARGRYEESGLSAREVARALNTSTSQLYRLLDPAKLQQVATSAPRAAQPSRLRRRRLAHQTTTGDGFLTKDAIRDVVSRHTWVAVFYTDGRRFKSCRRRPRNGHRLVCRRPRQRRRRDPVDSTTVVASGSTGPQYDPRIRGRRWHDDRRARTGRSDTRSAGDPPEQELHRSLGARCRHRGCRLVRVVGVPRDRSLHPAVAVHRSTGRLRVGLDPVVVVPARARRRRPAGGVRDRPPAGIGRACAGPRAADGRHPAAHHPGRGLGRVGEHRLRARPRPRGAPHHARRRPRDVHGAPRQARRTAAARDRARGSRQPRSHLGHLRLADRLRSPRHRGRRARWRDASPDPDPGPHRCRRGFARLHRHVPLERAQHHRLLARAARAPARSPASPGKRSGGRS